ncbi:four-carbon acid sugar kinase family protein [soil metagenome]
MIVVIADDLSGAAELAGIAHACGLRTEVQTSFVGETDAEVVCLDTDTRLCSDTEARHIVTIIARQVAASKPEWIYKKCDSVLRGHVRTEIQAIMKAAKLSHAMLISANPSRGRIIRGGEYFVHEQLLHETEFSRDPTHPRTVSQVMKILGGDLSEIDAPDAQSADDLKRYASVMDMPRTLAAGASEFFRTILEARGICRVSPDLKKPKPVRATLMVCGSATSWSRRSSQAASRGYRSFALPHDEVALAASLTDQKFALIGIGDSSATSGKSSCALMESLTKSVTRLLRQTPVTHLLLEGGATATAVVQALGFTRWCVEQPYAPGIEAMSPIHEEGPIFSMKPGSYDWPEQCWPSQKS